MSGALCIISRMVLARNGTGWLPVYAIFGVLTVLGTGNATQVNTITTSIDSALYN